ncbi:MAG TPA: N-6 DNA methylase, partial [Vicinamibacterales bacterium]|nr:N-6 DNA methylase [Vicinamibacterales bacterium]
MVTPFDGRLFAPRHAPLAASVRIDDRVAASIVGALARSDTGAPLSYADLGVEQLGAVYEQVLDFDPAVEPRGPGVQVILRRGVRRKSSGSFYTPRSITDYLVRRALHPLVERAMPEDVLALRVLDPAMGSGAFLVSACRYLARAYEEALVRSGAAGGGDFSETDRAGFRRLVAQRCLFGVDLNPTAVQLARLSLWLATLSGDRPLTFLDHALRVGNSLVGASPGDAGRRPFDSRRRRSRAGTPLFGPDEEEAGLRPALGVRLALASQPDDTPASVEHKERALAELASDAGPLAGMRAAADLWCAFWFWGEGGPGPAEAGALVDHAAGRPTTLPPARAASMMARGRAVAARERFFHWPLEFPEVFYQAGGLPRPNPGFDAVIGNPPWKMLRGDTGTPEDRRRAREASTRLGRFARQSGLYRLHDGGQGNLYQLFLERSLMLLRTGGRFGLLLPSGLAVDLGSAALRRYLLDRCALDALVSLDNRDGIFPIHRSLRFLLLTGTKGPQTTRLACRMGERSPAALDAIPDAGAPETAFPVSLTPALVRRIGGTDLVIPHLDSPFTAALVEKLAAFPALGSPSGWHARFGRELNATDDRDALSGGTDGLPVVEGKHLAPFSIDLGRCRLRIAEAEAKRRLPRAGFRRERLAYRDVTSSANRWPLIAVVLPAGVVTTHTVYCLRTPLPLEAQHFLCGVLNSFVVNYLVRLEVGTHVTTALVERLPVPRPDGDDPLFRAVASAARRLAVDPGDADAAGRLQGAAAALYRLTDDEWAGVLAGFPHASAAVREGSRRALAR